MTGSNMITAHSCGWNNCGVPAPSSDPDFRPDRRPMDPR